MNPATGAIVLATVFILFFNGQLLDSFIIYIYTYKKRADDVMGASPPDLFQASILVPFV